MERITKKDVALALENAKRAAGMVGIDTAGWRVDAGSATYGRAWRLYELRGGSTGHYNTCVHDYLGYSAREAHATLRHYADAWYAAADAARAAARAKMADRDASAAGL